MAQFDFNMYILNVTPDQVLSFSNTLIDGAIHIRITLNPTITLWRRRRYVCKDCSRSFSETNPFGPEKYHQSYAVLDSIAADLRNVHLSFKDIAQRHRTSTSLVLLYADSFLAVPRNTLPESLGIDEIHSNMADLSVISSRTVPSALFPNTSNRSLWKKGNACDSLPSIFGSHIKT